MEKKILLIGMGVVLAFGILETGLQTAGFVYKLRKDIRNRQAAGRKNSYRIMCIGESTTDGQYPQYLESALHKEAPGIQFTVIDEGRGGATTNVLLSLLEDTIRHYHPDMIVAMMGANDIPSDIVYTQRSDASRFSFKTVRLLRLVRAHMQAKLRGGDGRDASETGLSVSGVISRIREQTNHYGAAGKGLLYRALYTQKEKKTGTAQYKPLINVDPGMGVFYKDKKEYQKAIKAYAALLRADPESNSARVGLGDCFWGQQRYALAENMYLQSLQRGPGNERIRLRMGKYYYDQRRYSEARRMYAMVIDHNPKNDEAYAGLGQCFQGQDLYGQAEKMYAQAMKLNPGNDAHTVLLGDCYHMQRRYADAIKVYTSVIEHNPKNDQAYANIGGCLLSYGHYAHAEKMFVRALELNPANDFHSVMLGHCYYAQSRYAEAMKVFSSVIKRNPQNPGAYTGLGKCFQKQGRFAQAEKMYMKALALNPDYFNYVNMGVFYHGRERYTEAEKMFLSAQGFHPEDLNILCHLIDIYSRVGDHEKEKRVIEHLRMVKQKIRGETGFLQSLCTEDTGSILIGPIRSEYKDQSMGWYQGITAYNYQRLNTLCKERGIALVAMQYPTLSVEPLKQIVGPSENVVFVDNEDIFKNAVAQEGNAAYFRDMFGGSFGHCTPEGNKLLAANLARAIAKGVFDGHQ